MVTPSLILVRVAPHPWPCSLGRSDHWLAADPWDAHLHKVGSTNFYGGDHPDVPRHFYYKQWWREAERLL